MVLQPNAIGSPASEISHDKRALDATQPEKEPIFTGFTQLDAGFFAQPAEHAPEASNLPCPEFSPTQAARPAGVKNKNGTKMFKRSAQDLQVQAIETVESISVSQWCALA